MFYGKIADIGPDLLKLCSFLTCGLFVKDAGWFCYGSVDWRY